MELLEEKPSYSGLIIEREGPYHQTFRLLRYFYNINDFLFYASSISNSKILQR